MPDIKLIATNAQNVEETMKRIMISPASLLAVFTLCLFVMCGDIPTDPSTDPNNVRADITIPNIATGVIQGSPVTIRIVVRYPDMTEKINVTFDTIVPDTVIYCKTGSGALYDTINIARIFTKAGLKKLKADVELSNSSYKPFYCSFSVAEKKLTVAFDTVPVNHRIETGKPDTMRFVASTDPSGNAIDFSVVSFPPLDSTKLKLVDRGSDAIVIITAPVDTVYKVFVSAFNGNAKDTEVVNLVSHTKPQLNEVSSVTTIQPGKSEKIVFTLQVKNTDTINQVHLINGATFIAGEIVYIATGKDSLGFVFTPLETKVYTFLIETVVSNVKDTITYMISSVKSASKPWKQDTVTISAAEGSILSLSLLPYLNESIIGNTQFLTDKGTVTSGLITYSIPYGGSAKDSINIIASQGNNNSQIRIYLNIYISDTSKPSILPVAPLHSVLTTGMPSIVCKFIVTDSGSGIGAVAFSSGARVLADTSHTDSIYQCIVSNLVHGQKKEVCIKVTDKSMKRNVDSLIVYITYDSTATDTTAPVVAIVKFPNDSMVVSSSSLNVDVLCTDYNGIDTVICKLGSNAIPVEKGSASMYIASVSGLSIGPNTLIFAVKDGSKNENQTVKVISIIYDPTMEDNVAPAVRLKNPSTNGEILYSDSITVTIACKDDNGIASVTCTRTGLPLFVKSESDSLYSAALTGLTIGKADTVTFTVTDKSTKANKNTFVVIVKYVRYSVVYYENGKTGGVVPIDMNSYKPGDTVIVKKNDGLLIRNGYAFIGWNTLADCSGLIYPASNKFVMGAANVMLYANWTANIYSIKYNFMDNKNNCSANPQNYTIASQAILLCNPADQDAQRFDGWYTDSLFSAPVVTSIGCGTTGNIVLFAKWVRLEFKIERQPSTVIANVYDTVMFSVGIEKKGNEVLQYQWQKNNSNIEGATDTSLVIKNVTVNDSGIIFKCIVKTVSGDYSISSEAAMLKVVSVKAVSAGNSHTMILKSDGTLWGTGLNSSGQLGDTTIVNKLKPVSISTDVKFVSASYYTTMFIKNNESLWIAGSNQFGEFGNGSTTTINPKPAQLIINALMAYSGNYFSMLLKNDGSLWVAGNNENGQLGDGTVIDKNIAFQVMTDVASVSPGYNYNMFIKTDNTLWGNGSCSMGELGNGTISTNRQLIPIEVMSDVKAVFSGYSFTLILKTDGTLWGTGRNDFGQLGIGNSTNYIFTPAKIMDDVISVSTGNFFSMIVKKDGSLWATGLNNYGQFGNGQSSSVYLTTPVKVADSVTNVDIGDCYSMIIKEDGSLWATGLNNYGQLGDGTTINKTSFIRVKLK